MIRTLARRGAATLAMTGIVAFGALAMSPAASAAQDVDGSYEIVEFGKGNGPDAFLVTDQGRKPIFFCDEDKPNQRKKVCIPDPTTGGPRF